MQGEAMAARVKNAARLGRRLRSISPKSARLIKNVITKGAGDIEQTMALSIRGPGQGRIYKTFFYTDAQGRLRKVGKRSPPHRASAPNQPPATDQGGLKESISIQELNNGFAAEIGPNIEYAKYLEFGTSATSKHRGIAKRPFVGPAFNENKPAIKKAIRAALRKAIREASRVS
jgi:HK97 gp10 family phage protein